MTSGTARSQSDDRVDPDERDGEQRQARVRDRDDAPELEHLGQLLELRGAARERDHGGDVERAHAPTATSWPRTRRTSRRRRAAPSRLERRGKTASATTAVIAKLLTLNSELQRRLARDDDQRGDRADEQRAQVVAGRQEEKPTTAGNSLSENECVSRRKWTSTTLVSARKKPGATTGQGTRDRGRAEGPAIERLEVQPDRRQGEEHAEGPHPGGDRDPAESSTERPREVASVQRARRRPGRGRGPWSSGAGGSWGEPLVSGAVGGRDRGPLGVSIRTIGRWYPPDVRTWPPPSPMIRSECQTRADDTALGPRPGR